MFNGSGAQTQGYLLTLLIYIGSVIPEAMRKYFLNLITQEHENGKKYMRSVADSLRFEGWIEGRKKGRKEGKIEGRIEGKKEGWIEGKKEGLRSKETEDQKRIFRIAIELLRKHISVKEVARISGLTVYRVRKLMARI